MLVNITAGILGVFIYLFIFWKRLREDYSSELVFKTALTVLASKAVFILAGRQLIPDGFFYLGFAGAFLGLVISTYLNRVRFYETLEALVISLLPWISLTFLSHSINSASLASFFGFLGTLVIIFIFYYLDVNYKNFTWYKSGRIGFAGLAVLMIIFLTRFSLAILGVGMLSFVGVYEVWVSGFLAVLFLILLVLLGRKI